ncbi:MAG: hypothetical protein ACI81W_003965 [Saprospiraceae bacterium]|jgi:hypothetical protein
MNKIKVNLGRGFAVLKKSNQLIGVRIKPGTKTLPKELSDKKITHPWLAGFKIYKVGRTYKQVNAILDKVRKHPNILLGTHVYFKESSDKPIVPNGMIMVSFTGDAKKKEQEQLIKDLKLIKERTLSDTRIIAKVTRDSGNPLKVCVALKASSIVAEAIPDFDVPMTHYEFTMPKEDLFPLQWYLENKGATPGEPKGKIIKGADMRVVKAWKRLGNKGSNKIRIAIFDTGFQRDHPSFADKIVGDHIIWQDGGVNHHGTSCTGLAVASENGEGIIGVAPNAELVIIEGPTFSWFELEAAFKFCMDNDVDIISCSWGQQDFPSGHDPMHDQVFQDITTKGRNGKGCVVLFAAGNEDSEHVNVMGQMPNVICVAGSDSGDGHWIYSNRGEELSVTAPGGNWPLITSKASWADDYWLDGKSRGTPGLYKHFEGTSASTPLVAGVCALILSANPGLSALEVKQVLQSTADKIGVPDEYTNGHSIRFGYGRVNADAAVAEALRLKDPSSVLPDLATGSGGGLYHFEVDPLPASGWGVQTGALREFGNVLKMVDQLQKLFGKVVNIHISELNGQPNYKIILGPFATKAEATSFQKKVTAAGLSSFLKSLKGLK